MFVRRLAMWSGPRNISTAMMRAWENRSDSIVVDEPFYAYWLKATGEPHPGRDAIIEHDETDEQRVIDRLLGPLPEDRSVFYQKLMAHHLLDEMDLSWIPKVTNCLLIRDPAEMIASYSKVIDDVRPENLGLPQQVMLYDLVSRETGSPPPILDARDVLLDPKRLLGRLCELIDVPFEDRMLRWPRGRRDSDGVWAPHWYANVEKSTGFAPHESRDVELSDELKLVHEACLDHYSFLRERRLT